jgi:TolB-like protein
MDLKTASVALAHMACVLVGAGALSVASAEAPRGPSVVVVPFQPAESEISSLMLDRVTALVVDELRRGGQLAIAEPGAVPPSGVVVAPPVAGQALKEAERLYGEGRARVQKQEFDEAVQLLASSLKKIEENLAEVSDYGLLADIHLWLGIAQFRAGNEAEGTAALTRALVLRPALQLDPERYPPLFRRIVEEARTRVQSGPKGRLRVDSTPPGCEVLLNGVVRGRTPVEIPDLPAGRHYLRISCAGYEPQALVREVPAGATVAASVQLVAAKTLAAPADPMPPLLARLRQGLIDGPTLHAIREVAVQSAASFVIVGYVAREAGAYGLRAYLFRAQDGRLVPLPAGRFDPELLNAVEQARLLARAAEKTVVTFPPPGAPLAAEEVAPRPSGQRPEIRSAADLARVEARLAREELERLAREERERRLASLGRFDPTQDRTARPEPPWYKKWWFWTIVGAVVVGGVTGAAVGASSRKGGSATIGLRWGVP